MQSGKQCQHAASRFNRQLARNARILNPLLSRYKRPRIRPDRSVSGCPLASELSASLGGREKGGLAALEKQHTGVRAHGFQTLVASPQLSAGN